MTCLETSLWITTHCTVVFENTLFLEMQETTTAVRGLFAIYFVVST